MARGYSPPTAIKPRPEFADILKSQEQFAQPEREGVGNSLNGWFDQLVLQAGVPVAPLAVLLSCVLFAVLLGGAVFVWQENPITAGLAMFVGMVIPIGIMMVVRSRRQALILRQLPPMIDELARAARTGRSLDQCLEMVADDTPQPMGGEMQLCVRKLQMGVTMNEALYDLPDRTGVGALRILATALSVHQQTGGDLVQVLERLARTLRDRGLFLGRLRAITAGSRATALLMIILPPAILTFFVFRDPDYLNRLMASGWGRFITIAAIMLEIIGAIWILKILNDTKQT